jgi:uncharacterized protein YdhG (YjbR/CyaY superfamily)
MNSKNLELADLKSTMAALSDHHRVEIAALQDELKWTTAALAKQHNMEIAAIHDKLNTHCDPRKRTVKKVSKVTRWPRTCQD